MTKRYWHDLIDGTLVENIPLAELTTDPATSITSDAATLSGSVDTLEGNTGNLDFFFEWGEVGAGFPNSTIPSSTSTAPIAYTSDISGLSQNTDYEFRAAGTVDGETFTGGTQTFTTASGIPDSVVNRWPIDEGSGSTIADSIGSNDGTVNGATWTSGTWIGGYALSLDGADDYLSFSTVPVIDVSTEFAVSVTVDLATLSFSGQRNIMHHQTSNSNRFAISADGDNNSINAGLFDGSSFVALGSGGVSAGQKVRIVYNHDGSGNGELYLNTTEQTSTENPSTIANETGFEIGRRLDGANYLEFDVDEPMIYNTQRASAQVQDDYDRQPWS